MSSVLLRDAKLDDAAQSQCNAYFLATMLISSSVASLQRSVKDTLLLSKDRSDYSVTTWLKTNIDLGYAIIVAEAKDRLVAYACLGRNDASYIRYWDGTPL